MNKVLIITNPLNHEGGVVNYYRLFLKYFYAEDIELIHLAVGSRMEYFYSPIKKRALYPLYLSADILRLVWLLFTDQQIRVVQVNPSLIPVPLIRDACIILVAKVLHRSVIVFFRGWRDNVANIFKRRPLERAVFRLVYGRADQTLVLASRFRDDLLEMGWKSERVRVTTTMYKSGEVLPFSDRGGQTPRFVFLGRVSQLKGVDELIEAAKLLADRNIDFDCVIVGHGERERVLDDYQNRISAKGLEGSVRLTGRLTGNDKYRTYAEGDVYVFPSWTEGCPNSVIEALGAGLFVISTDVGALRDIIREGDNGRFVRCQDPEHLAAIMEWACEHIEDLRCRRRPIQQEAKTRFEVDVVCKQFRDIYQNLAHG